MVWDKERGLLGRTDALDFFSGSKNETHLLYCEKNKRNKTKQQKKGNENVHVPGLFSVVLTFPFSVLWLKGEWGSALASRLSCCTWGLSFICLVPGLGREVLPPFVRVLLFQWLQSVVLVPKCEMDKPVPRGTNSGGLWAASLVWAQACCSRRWAGCQQCVLNQGCCNRAMQRKTVWGSQRKTCRVSRNNPARFL